MVSLLVEWHCQMVSMMRVIQWRNRNDSSATSFFVHANVVEVVDNSPDSPIQHLNLLVFLEMD